MIKQWTFILVGWVDHLRQAQKRQCLNPTICAYHFSGLSNSRLAPSKRDSYLPSSLPWQQKHHQCGSIARGYLYHQLHPANCGLPMDPLKVGTCCRSCMGWMYPNLCCFFSMYSSRESQVRKFQPWFLFSWVRELVKWFVSGS